MQNNNSKSTESQEILGIESEYHFTIVNDQVIEDESLSGVEVLTFMALAYFANNKTGVCWPSIKSIVQKAHASERSVQRALKVLTEKGYLKCEEREGKDGGQTSNLYTILAKRTTPGCHTDTPPGATQSPKLYLKKELNSQSKNAVEVGTSKNGTILFSWPEVQKLAVEMHQAKEFIQNRIDIAIKRMENLPEPRTNPKGWIIEAVKNGWGDTEYKTGEQEDKESERRCREEKAADDKGFDKAEKRYADCPEAQTFFALRKGMIGKPTITSTIQAEDENRLIELHKQRVTVLQAAQAGG